MLQLQARVDGPRFAQLLGLGLRALRGLRGQLRLLGVWGAAQDRAWDDERVSRSFIGLFASRLHAGL